MRSTTQSDDKKQEDDWSSTPVHTITAQISREGIGINITGMQGYH